MDPPLAGAGAPRPRRQRELQGLEGQRATAGAPPRRRRTTSRECYGWGRLMFCISGCRVGGCSVLLGGWIVWLGSLAANYSSWYRRVSHVQVVIGTLFLSIVCYLCVSSVSCLAVAVALVGSISESVNSRKSLYSVHVSRAFRASGRLMRTGAKVFSQRKCVAGSLNNSCQRVIKFGPKGLELFLFCGVRGLELFRLVEIQWLFVRKSSVVVFPEETQPLPHIHFLTLLGRGAARSRWEGKASC